MVTRAQNEAVVDKKGQTAGAVVFDRSPAHTKVITHKLKRDMIALAMRNQDLCEIEHARTLADRIVYIAFDDAGKAPQRDSRVVFVFGHAGFSHLDYALVDVQPDRDQEYCGEAYKNYYHGGNRPGRAEKQGDFKAGFP